MPYSVSATGAPHSSTATRHRGRRRPLKLWLAVLALVLHSSLLPQTAAQQRSRGELLSKGGTAVATGRRLQGKSLGGFDPTADPGTQLSNQLSSHSLTQHSVVELESSVLMQQSRQGRGLSQSGVSPPKRSLEDKIAHAAEVRAMKPDLLLKNLKIREQNTTEYIPEACAERDELGTTTCVLAGLGLCCYAGLIFETSVLMRVRVWARARRQSVTDG